MPIWRQGMAVGEWRQIAGTAMASAPLAVKTFPSLGNTGPSSKVVAWTSLAINTRDSSLYSAANGGHMDYAGNEVNRIRLADNTPAWSESLPATPAVQVTASSAYYADGKPSSRHSYYGQTVNEVRNRVMTLGGSRFGDGGVLSTVDGFNLETNSWDAAGTFPSNSDLSSVAGPAIVDNKATGDIFLFSNWKVWKWTSSTNTWSLLVTGGTIYGQYSASAFDSRRNHILVLGGNGNDHGVYDLATNTITPVAAVLNGDGNALAYDSGADVFLLRSGLTTYRINASTFAVDQMPTSGLAPAAAPNGPWRRFLYVPSLKGVVYVPTYNDNIWFMRTN